MLRIQFVIWALVTLCIPRVASAQIYTTLTWAPIQGHLDFILPHLAFSSFGHSCTVAYTEQLDSPLFALVKPVFLRSNNDGKSWKIQDPGFPNVCLEQFDLLCQIDSLNVIAAGDSDLGLYRTKDGGATWDPMNSPIYDELSSLHFSDPQTGICTCGYNTYTTTDGGNHWDTIQINTGTWPETCHSYGNGKFRVYAYAYGPVYTTYDNWNSYDSSAAVVPHGPGLPNKVLGYCNFSGGDTLFAYGNDLDSTTPYALIFRSTDSGAHWSQVVDLDSSFESVTCMSDASRDTIVAGGYAALNKVLISFDHGASWKTDTLLCDTSFEQGGCRGIALTPSGNLIAGFNSTFGYGGLVYGVFGVEGVKSTEVVSSGIQVYPNPSYDAVNITSINSGQQVNVVDLLGREVLRAIIPSDGPLKLDVSSLPSGLYFVTDGNWRVKFAKE